MTDSPTVEQPEIWRIFSGEDGKSRMELLDVKMAPRGGGGLASAFFPATAVQAVYIAPDMDVRWHNAPRRQVVVTVAGEGELETGDGQVLVLRPGVMTVVEDVEGEGHLTRPRGSAGRLVLFVPLGEGAELDG
jgi:uncharacterized protein YhdP